jgi:hypothetical protein
MQIAGTSARAVDVEGGMALELTTTGDVAELRRRVTKMAAMHESGCGGMMGPDGGMGHGHGMMSSDGGMGHGHGMMGGGMGGMPAASVRAEDIAQGARLIFTPKDPKDIEALRLHGRRHAESANAGMCPMMGMHGGSPPPPPPAASAPPQSG